MKYDIVKLMARRKIRWKKRWVSGDSGGRLTFRSKKAGTLENYRIYGNTVGGESVGDRTGNLFDCKTERIPSIAADITSMSVNETLQTISITANNTDARVGRAVESGADYAGDLGYKYPCEAGKYYYLSGSNDVFDKNFLTFFNDNNISLGFSRVTTTAIQAPNNATYFTIRFGVANSVSGQTYTDKLMITELSTFEPPSIYEPYGYKVPVTVSNGTDTLTTPIYLAEQIRKVGSEAEYVDYYSQTLHRVRKNLLQNTATSQTINGVAFTVNEDGRVTCNGTARAITYFNLNENFNSTLYAGMKASFYQSEQQPNVNTFMIRLSKANRVSIQDFTMNDQVIIDNGDSLLLAIRINSGYTCNNLTFYPMIRKADISDDTYEPYIENTEVDVTLPALPTLAGTNVLSVGTAVQPSKIEVKGRIKAVGQETEPEQEAAEAEQEAAEPEPEAAEAEQE